MTDEDEAHGMWAANETRTRRFREEETAFRPSPQEKFSKTADFFWARAGAAAEWVGIACKALVCRDIKMCLTDGWEAGAGVPGEVLGRGRGGFWGLRGERGNFGGAGGKNT